MLRQVLLTPRRFDLNNENNPIERNKRQISVVDFNLKMNFYYKLFKGPVTTVRSEECKTQLIQQHQIDNNIEIMAIHACRWVETSALSQFFFRSTTFPRGHRENRFWLIELPLAICPCFASVCLVLVLQSVSTSHTLLTSHNVP